MAKDDGYTKEVANRKHVGARGCDLIVELASRGCTKPTIARALRIGVKTLRACRKRQPEVAEAFERGEAMLHDSLFKVLLDEAHNKDSGKRAICAMFLLKARFGYRDQGPTTEDPNKSNVQVNINLPASVPLEDFLRQTGGVQVTTGDGHTARLKRE